MRFTRAASAAAVLLLLAAGDASACPACASGSTAWFRYTTILLSLVPVAAIGGVIWWIRRQVTTVGAEPGP